jgi:riboflavin biosynthesis pyrimidine reductase
LRSREVPSLIVTTETGARHQRESGLRTPVGIEPGGMSVCAQAVLTAVRRTEPGGLALVEGGPHLIGHFFAEKILDELF